VQRPVRPAGVVMVGVLAEDQLQVPFAGDQHPVQARTRVVSPSFSALCRPGWAPDW
jgi:hypothetical protein